MTTNQEGRQAAIRDSTSTAYGVAADWNALFDDAGISAGTFNERLLAWINAELSASHSNLVSAMQAYAEDAGYDGWEDMATLVLAMNGAETLLDGETQGLAFDFTDQSALIIDTGTPANNYDSAGIVSSGSLVGPLGKLVYTSPSNKLTMQSDGVMRYQAHNLVTYSNDFENAIYFDVNSSQTDNSATDSRGEMLAATILGAGIQWGFAVLGVTFISGAKYRIAFEIKPKAGDCDDWLKLVAPNGTSAWVDITNATVGTLQSEFDSVTVTSLGSGWLFVEAIITPAANAAYYLQSVSTNEANSTINTTGTFYITRMHCSRYPCETDYIATAGAAKYALPIEYDTSGNCLGLLVEEARTNLVPYSLIDDGTQWTEAQVTNTANAATAPDGTTTAAQILADAGSAVHYCTDTFAVAASAQAHSFSVYIKAGTASYAYVRVNGGAPGLDTGYVINLTTGAVAQTVVAGDKAPTVADVGNSWWRVTWYDTTNGTGGSPSFSVGPHDGTAAASWTASGTETIFVWCAQAEVGSFPTSPILTYSAAATRNVDNISISRTSTPLPAMTGASDAMSIFVETIGTLADGSSDYYILNIDAGANTNRLYLYYNNTTEVGWGTATTDAGAQTLFELATMNAAQTQYKFAARWKNDDCAVSFENETQATDTSVDVMGSAITTIRIGSAASNGGPYNGIIRKIAIVPSEWSNATLEAKVGN